MDVGFETAREGSKAGKDEWLTPPLLIKALGEFDLDPCSPVNRPWDTAKKHYTEIDNGLMQNWEGRVWCNPPYGNHTGDWLARCAAHKNAIVLTFARTETKMFFEYVWKRAEAVFFIQGRLKFWHVDGTEGGTAGAPSILIAYDQYNAEVLRTCKLKGKFLKCNL